MVKPKKFFHRAASSSLTRKKNTSEFSFDLDSNNSSFLPMFSVNHYNDDDYDIFEDIWAHTLVGDVIDTRIQYAMGEAIKPKAVLRHPTKFGNEDQQQKELEKYSDIIDELTIIDEKPKIKLFEKITDAARMTKVFGRDVIGFEPGEGAPPTALKVIHPRMLGRVFFHQDDWSVSSVYTHAKLKQLTREDEMIYFTNMFNSPRYRAMGYGYSDIQRVAGHARALREITEFDIIEIAKAMFAGYGIVTVDQENMNENEKQDDLNRIARALKVGGFGVLSKQGEKGIDFNSFNLNPDISGITALMDKLEQEIIGHGQVPGPILGREEEANRATGYMKLRAFLHGPVRADRKWISNILSQQWYEFNLQFLDQDALKEIKIVPEFENFPVDGWSDAMEDLLKLRTLLPNLPDEEILKLADLAHLKDKLNDEGMSADSMNAISKETDNIDLKNKLQHLVQDNVTNFQKKQKNKK